MLLPILLLSLSAGTIGPAERVKVKPSYDRKVATVAAADVEQWFNNNRNRFLPCVLKAVGPHPLLKDDGLSLIFKEYGYVVVEHGRIPSESATLRFTFGKNGKLAGLLKGPVSTLLIESCADKVYGELQMEGTSNETVELSFRVTAEPVDVEALVKQARLESGQYCGWLEGIRKGRAPKEIVDVVQSASKADAFYFASAAWSDRQDLAPFSRSIGSTLANIGPCDREAVFATMLADLGAPKVDCSALRTWAREDAEGSGQKCGQAK